MCASLHWCVIDFFFLVVIVLRVSFRCVCGVHHTPNLGQRSKSVFLALVSVCGSVSRCAFSLSTTLSAKVLESSKDSLFFSVKQYFDFPAHWMTFCVLCVCVRQVFLWQMFSLMFCYSFYFAWLSQPLGWFCLCNFDFVEWKYLLFSLHFDCNVLFLFLRYVYLGCFLSYFNLKTLCLQSRMLNSYKWLKMKKVKVVICIVLLFILLSLCVCVFSIG